MHILDILKERGFVSQVTFEEDLYKQLEREATTFYLGIDPTADSIHLGHYVPVMAMAHLQRAGHVPIPLMGGGTAMIADPSGKTAMRSMLSVEEIDRNVDSIQTQLDRVIDFTQGRAILENNAPWLRALNFIDFTREIGAFFSVNRMLTAECYKARLEKGLSFLEFTYMLLQAYDFLELFRRHNCRLQIGGDDQWSNMLAGADLIRRKERQDAFALTFNLLLTSDGRKMGKTESGTVWMSAERTSPYELYQYLRNIADADVKSCLSMLTFLPMDEVCRLAALRDAAINDAKRVLAFEFTRIMHGQEAAEQAQQAAAALFGGGGDAQAVPTAVVTADQLAQDARITTLVVRAGLAASNSEARKLVQGGGIYLGDTQVTDVNHSVPAEAFGADGLLVRKGKKSYCRVRLEG